MSKTLELFKEITKIPRPSGKEGKIRDYLINWSISKGLEYSVDSFGNLIVFVKSSSNPDSEPLILQSHIDMVCVKTPESNHDFEKDFLDIYEEDGFLKARNTSLGADDGSGIAILMSAVDFENKPNLELVFTVDEEVGMSGVANLDFSLLKSKKVINLDNECDDEICISSAGGVGVMINKEFKLVESYNIQYRISLFGMKGGHSGDEIHKNQGNAIKFLIDFLYEYGFSYDLCSINGGTAINVIPTSAEIVIGTANIELFEDSLKKYIELIKDKYDCKDLGYKIEQSETKFDVIEEKDLLISKIHDIKIGVYKISEKIPDLTETSMNLGILKLSQGKCEIIYLARSSINEELINLYNKTSKFFSNSSFIIIEDIPFLGWQGNPEDELVLIAKNEFEKVNGILPKIVAVHAGLECGALVTGCGEGTSAISIGPTMYDVHSVNERVEIASIERMEKILEGILSKLV